MSNDAAVLLRNTRQKTRYVFKVISGMLKQSQKRTKRAPL